MANNMMDTEDSRMRQEAIRRMMDTLDKAEVPQEDRAIAVFARPGETEDECMDRMCDIHHARYMAQWRDYCRPVEFIFRIEWLLYEALVSYHNPAGKLHHAYVLAYPVYSRWYYESLMYAARAARCYACEESE